MRLDRRIRATEPARSGAIAIVPGHADQSALVRRIFASSDDERMPPPQSKKTLTHGQKELLKKWIDQGAEYQVHWAFRSPVRPDLPRVNDQAWVRNELDGFILARLERAGLKPSPRADKETLIRRLSLDLRGLPPSVAEVDAFLADPSPDAYARLVDRMLASPHYGEKMAQTWLDLARFGDTSGYHFDSTRQMWLWRDWVIEAFNGNMPYDRFTIEQMAGDLLTSAPYEGGAVSHKIASGFHRNTRFNEEGGVDPEEFVVRYNVDRANTLGQIWLGLTLGCAECHDHKYDPISQKEYYQLFAYFTGIKEPMVSANHNQPLPPLLKVPTAEQAKTLQKLRQEMAILQKEVASESAALNYRDPLAADADAAVLPAQPEDVVWLDDEPPAGAKLGGTGAEPWQWGSFATQAVYSGKRSMRRSGAGLHQHFFTEARNAVRVFPGDVLFTYAWLDPKDPPRSIQLQYADGTWEHRAYWGEDLCYRAGTADGPGHFFAGPLPKVGQWIRLEIDTAKIGLAPGARVNGMAFIQYDGTAYYDKAGVCTRYPPDERVFNSQIAWEPRGLVDPAVPAEVRAALGVQPARRDAAQRSVIRDYYLLTVYRGARDVFEPLHAEFAAVRKKFEDVEDAVPHTLVTEEMPEPRPAYVLLRGDWLQKGEQVNPAVPALFPALPKGAPNNRLGLAQWLVRPDHPLTARVAVNRLWAQMFGSGIVAGAGDFGTQGDPPSHPELLDWLATEFMRSGWDVKEILRKIALSNTYQQTSALTPGPALEIDPHNRLLARAPRQRLNAEEIRDSALAISGLLNPKTGGPSFMPYQPPDFYKGKHEDWIWTPSTGPEQYRRGLYAFWRRTNLHPMFAILDAPSRTECAVARPRTNTPVQALVTLNDTTFVEAARVFAQNILTQEVDDLDRRLTYAFRAALARVPNSAEVQILKSRLQTLLKHYQADPDAALQLVSVGLAPRLANLDVAEHAAWTGVAQIILNLDETMTRE